MAFSPRTINQIYSAIITEKSRFPSLSGLTSPVVDLPSLLSELDSGSQVAIWSLWAYVSSVIIWSLESNMAQLEADVETEKLTATVGNLEWYTQQTLLFQYGYILTIDPTTFKPYYETIDPTAQIIMSATAQEQFGSLQIKVRRVSTDILTTTEKNAFLEYLRDIKFVGTHINVVNYLSDKLKLYLTILYNSLEPLASVQPQVEQVINNYCANIEFDSIFKTNALIDALQQLPFVDDVQFTTLYARPNSSVTFQTFIWSYQSTAGYCEIDPAFPLSGTITYLPQ